MHQIVIRWWRTYVILSAIFICIAFKEIRRPVLYIMGDSTVATGAAAAPTRGWGGMLTAYFDTARISISNRAVGGTSTRTFYTGVLHDKTLATHRLWKGIEERLQPGDYVIMQFGHNDESPVWDTARARGTIAGTGEDTLTGINPFTKEKETVHSYGWYMAAFIQHIQRKNAIPVVCSPIPKNRWKNGHIIRNSEDYGKWAAAAAQQNSAFYIDLNAMAADAYDQLGEAVVSQEYFASDKIHTTPKGAALHAALVAKAISNMTANSLKNYLK